MTLSTAPNSAGLLRARLNRNSCRRSARVAVERTRPTSRAASGAGGWRAGRGRAQAIPGRRALEHGDMACACRHGRDDRHCRRAGADDDDVLAGIVAVFGPELRMDDLAVEGGRGPGFRHRGDCRSRNSRCPGTGSGTTGSSVVPSPSADLTRHSPALLSQSALSTCRPKRIFGRNIVARQRRGRDRP